MEKIVVAVIGCGRIAIGQHFPALDGIDEVRIKYACDIIAEKAEAMKKKYEKVENAITDYRIALDDPEVEAVWVLTPNYMHYEITMAALRADKHVFCEKPVTVNYALSCEMAEESRKQSPLKCLKGGTEREDSASFTTFIAHSADTEAFPDLEERLRPRHSRVAECL